MEVTGTTEQFQSAT